MRYGEQGFLKVGHYDFFAGCLSGVAWAERANDQGQCGPNHIAADATG